MRMSSTRWEFEVESLKLKVTCQPAGWKVGKLKVVLAVSLGSKKTKEQQLNHDICID